MEKRHTLPKINTYLKLLSVYSDFFPILAMIEYATSNESLYFLLCMGMNFHISVCDDKKLITENLFLFSFIFRMSK